MPAGLSHYLFAEELLTLPEVSARVRNARFFHFGAQAHDVLYLYRIEKETRRSFPEGERKTLGYFLHQRGGEALFASLGRQCGEGELLSLSLGMLSHYAFDTVVHPYVYACEARLEGAEEKVHYRLESDFDLFLLARIRESGDFPYYREIRLTGAECDRISDFLSRVCEETYGFGVDGRRFRGAVHNFDRVAGLLYDRRYVKQTIMRGIERTFRLRRYTSALFHRREPDRRFLNEERKPWANPAAPETERRESLFELYDAAKEEYLRLAEEFCAGNYGGMNKNCNTGI